MKIDSFCLISNYDNDLNWLKEYSDNYVIYDQHENSKYPDFIDKSKVVKREHIGADIYDKFSWIVENYDNLPEVVVMIKANLFKYISKEELDVVCNNKTFTPLLTQKHKTYSDNNGVVCYYSGGLYYERNNSWYVSEFPFKYFSNYGEFAQAFQLPNPLYLPFAPGSNYIVTKKDIHKYSKDFYAKLMSCLDYTSYSAEAQMCERSLYTIFK